MKLIDLNPIWVGTGGEGITETKTGKPVPRRERVAIEFDCPCGCGRPVCIPFLNPDDGGKSVYQNYGWQREGTTFETLTLTPSILRSGGCGWHGFVTKGEIVNA